MRQNHKTIERHFGNFFAFESMPRRCRQCHGVTPMIHVDSCPHCKLRFHRSTPSLTRLSPHPTSCLYKTLCGEYLSALKWQENYFDRSQNRCYCSRCYPSAQRDTYEVEGYFSVIPRGWCRFGLRVDQVRAQIDQIWDKWIVTYHGTSTIAAQSIVAHRQLLLPGDRCIDGSMIAIPRHHIKDKNEIYTSPSIAYSSHPCYCPTHRFRSRITNKTYEAKLVLQCRQKPGTFNVQGETIGAGRQRLCRFIPNDQIEFYTTIRAAIVIYGVLIELTEIK